MNKFADKYQGLFNLMYKDHNLTLTISEMDDIIYEAQRVVKLFAIPIVSGSAPEDESTIPNIDVTTYIQTK